MVQLKSKGALHGLQQSISAIPELNHFFKYSCHFFSQILLDNEETIAPNSEFTW